MIRYGGGDESEEKKLISYIKKLYKKDYDDLYSLYVQYASI